MKLVGRQPDSTGPFDHITNTENKLFQQKKEVLILVAVAADSADCDKPATALSKTGAGLQSRF